MMFDEDENTVSSRVKESLGAHRSPDNSTRRASYFFMASLLALLFTLIIGAVYMKHRWERKRVADAAIAQVVAIEVARKEEERKRNAPPTYQTLGAFSLELREKAGVVRAKHSINSAEMEVVVACNEPALCDFIKKNMDLARGELSSLFVAADREKLLSIPGKKAFRDEIRDQLNRWLEKSGEKGQVIDVLFPRFIMS